MTKNEENLRREHIYEQFQSQCFYIARELYDGADLPPHVRDYLVNDRGIDPKFIRYAGVFYICDYLRIEKWLKQIFSHADLHSAGLLSRSGRLIFYPYRLIIPYPSFSDDNGIEYLRGHYYHRSSFDPPSGVPRWRNLALHKGLPLYDINDWIDLSLEYENEPPEPDADELVYDSPAEDDETDPFNNEQYDAYLEEALDEDENLVEEEEREIQDKIAFANISADRESIGRENEQWELQNASTNPDNEHNDDATIENQESIIVVAQDEIDVVCLCRNYQAYGFCDVLHMDENNVNNFFEICSFDRAIIIFSDDVSRDRARMIAGIFALKRKRADLCHLAELPRKLHAISPSGNDVNF